MQIKDDISDIISKNPKYYHIEIKKKYQSFLEDFCPNRPLKEQIYIFLNGYKKCSVCGSSNLYFLSIKKGFSETCSKKCAVLLPSRIQNQNPTSEIKNKIKKTKKERYGNENFNNIGKILKTKEEKYGSSSFNNREKAKTTSLKRYGKNSTNQVEEIKNKQKKAVQEKYNVDNISQSNLIKTKKKNTFLKNYGVEHYAKTEEYKNKFKNNTHHMQLRWAEDVKNILLNPNILEKELKSKTPEELAKELNIAFTTVYNYAIKYGIRKKYTDFSTEIVVQNILDQLNVNYVKNDRTQIKPKELDFYLKDYNLAIEVCGLFWHSELQGKDKNYHLHKLNLCEEKNIRLITVFEDELQNIEKLKHRFENIFKKSKKICGARNCVIQEISLNEAREFFNKTHLQNHSNGKIYLGAFFNKELVAAMSFGNLRKSLGSKNEKDVYELIRYSCSGNISGIGSKLLSYFKKTYLPKKIISYCDKRWSQGNFYKSLGFVLEKQTSPNYWYTLDYRIRKHRFSLTKHKIIQMGGDSKLTEWQNAQNFGFDRIWDCGSSKWILDCSKD